MSTDVCHLVDLNDGRQDLRNCKNHAGHEWNDVRTIYQLIFGVEESMTKFFRNLLQLLSCERTLSATIC